MHDMSTPLTPPPSSVLIHRCSLFLSSPLTLSSQLRSIYSNLSQDPNSLSNLDQDLPNFAQIEVIMLAVHALRSVMPQYATLL